jgi:hypothetical protein
MGDIVDSGIELLYGPASLSWRAVTTTLCRSQRYPPSRHSRGLRIWQVHLALSCVSRGDSQFMRGTGFFVVGIGKTFMHLLRRSQCLLCL